MKKIDSDSMNFSKGDLIIFTRGEYSDYCFEGPFRAIATFNLKTACASIVMVAWENCKHLMRPFSEMEKLGFDRQYNLDESDEVDYPLTDLIKEFITPSNVPSLLVRNNFIEPVEARQFHLGEYSYLSFME